MKLIRNLKFRIRNYSFLAAVFTFSFLLFPSLADASAIARPANNLGLVGYWSFEDATGTKATDFSGNGNVGTLTGSTTLINGKRGKAVSFDNTNAYIDAGDVTILNGATAATWSLWVKFDSLSTTSRSILTKWGDGGTEQDFLINEDSTNSDELLIAAQASGNNYYIASTVGADFTTGVWYHIVTTYTATSTFKVYVNGTEKTLSVTQGNPISAIQNGTTNLQFGRETDESVAPIDGQIDEVRIYNRALSATEVTALYGTGAVRRTNPNNRGLVGYWSFEDGTSTQATDFSGKGYTGTLTNGPTWVNGKRGKALSFDGSNDYVLIPSSSVALDNLSEVTWSAWIKRGAFATSSYIMEKGVKYAQIKSDDTIEFRFMCNTGFGPLTGSTNTITDTNWHHIVGALSFSGDGLLHIYLDGVEVSYSIQQGCFNGIDLEAGNGLTIGISNSLTAPFNGQIDEVRVYNRALSAAEAASLYAAGASTLNTSRPVLSTSSLVLWHTFDGPYLNTTTSTDRSGQSNHGTLAGAGGAQNKPQVTIGKSGQALSFDGTDDYVSIASTPANLDLTTFTIAWWMNTGSDNPYIFSNGIQNNNKGFQINTACNNQREICIQRNVVGDNEQIRTSDGTLWDQNTWVHVAVTVDGTTVGVYINGVNKPTTGSWSGSINSYAGTAFNIGARSTLSSFFPGYLDDVRVYNTALTAAEVKKLYDAGK